MTALRRPGSPWRLLVHVWLGKQPGGLRYGDSWNIDNADPGDGRRHVVERIDDGAYIAHTRHLPGTEFDELVVGEWLHVEQMDKRLWWMNVGGVTVMVTARKDGTPKRVTVYGPVDYDMPRDRCTYECNWTGDGGAVRDQQTGEEP